jgi:hypothetical protein
MGLELVNGSWPRAVDLQNRIADKVLIHTYYSKGSKHTACAWKEEGRAQTASVLLQLGVWLQGA